MSRVMAPLESIVGRTDAIARVLARLDDARVCCITGPVGVGKTLVARAVASEPRLAGAVLWCDASASGSLDALLDGLAVPLGPALLVLDGADGLALRDALPRWLGEDPERKALVTSRERPGVAGEAMVILEPLAEADAIALFIRRASALDDRFAADADARAIIAAIVRLVDGLPLAIELAAAQTLVLSPAALLAHLESAEARLDARDRGDSLRQTIAAAWALLPEKLASVMIGCSIFEGTFSFAAASHVVGADVAALQSLCERSFIHSFDASGARRFRIYASLRDYARSHGIDEQVRQRHRTHHLASLASKAEPFETKANLVASAEHDVATGEHARALETLVAVAPLVLLQGPVTSTLALFDRAWSAEPSAAASCARGRLRVLDGQLAAANRDLEEALQRSPADSALRAVIFAELASVARQRGHAEEASAHYERGLAEPAAEPAVRAQIFERLAGHHFEQGDMMAARARLRDAEVAYEANGDAPGLARVAHAKGSLEQEAGDLAVAARCFDDAELRHRELGNARFSAIARFDQGALLLEQGDAQGAQRVLRDAVTRLAAVGDRRQVLLGRALLGVCAVRLGDLVEAAALLERAQREADAVGDEVFARAVRVHRGHLDPSSVSLESARSDEERYALRLLALSSDTLGIARDGSFVERATGERAGVRSKAAQRMLVELVAHERGVSVTQLFRAGWPGERALDEAQKNRVHVALSSLRTAGLGERLVRTADGYTIKGPVRVH